MVYSIHVDNSNSKFKSKLKEKHHALGSRSPNLKIIDNDTGSVTSWLSDQVSRLHPYQEELIHFKVASLYS